MTNGSAGDKKPWKRMRIGKLRHDTFSSDGTWKPPGGRELYFHSGLSEDPSGLEADGLGTREDPDILQAVLSIAAHLDRVKSNSGETSIGDTIEIIARELRAVLGEEDGESNPT